MFKIPFVIILAIIMGTAMDHSALGNGGDQRVNVKEGYLVNLSRAPFTPVAGTKTVMLVSFVDLKTGSLVRDNLVARIRIARGRSSMDFIHEESNIPVQGGVFEYSYTFRQPGLHEIFFDFVRASDPAQKRVEMPDFLMDIQPLVSRPTARAAAVITPIILGAALGFLVGWFIRGKRVR